MSGSKRPLRLRFPPLDRGLPDGPEQGCWKTRSKSQLRTTQGVLKEGNQVPHSNSSASEVSLASARPPRRGGGREGAGSFRGRGGGRAEAFLHRAGRSRSPCPLSGRLPGPRALLSGSGRLPVFSGGARITSVSLHFVSRFLLSPAPP